MVKFPETERRIEGATNLKKRVEELLFKWYRVSAGEDENISRDGWW